MEVSKEVRFSDIVSGVCLLAVLVSLWWIEEGRGFDVAWVPEHVLRSRRPRQACTDCVAVMLEPRFHNATLPVLRSFHGRLSLDWAIQVLSREPVITQLASTAVIREVRKVRTLLWSACLAWLNVYASRRPHPVTHTIRDQMVVVAGAPDSAGLPGRL